MNDSSQIDVTKIKRGPIVVALIIGAFVSILNETLLNVAFPDLMDYFGVAEPTVQWLATSYMLVVGILVPITALLQQWFTTRQMFLGAMTLFLCGTIVCATAPIFEMLLVGRVIQALGTGLMLPVLMNTILLIYPPESRGTAMGTIGLVIMSAPTIGPTLSGLIVDELNWRWLFYLVIPLACISILFAAFFLKNVSELTKPRVDFISIILSCVGFGGIVYGFSAAGEHSWSYPAVLWCLIVGGISLTLFVWRQLVVQSPILDLRAFRYPMFTLVTVLLLILMMSMFATMIMLPMFLQRVLLMTALAAGLTMMPGSIVNGIMSPISGALFDKFGPRMLVIPGLALMAASVWLFTGIEPTWSNGYVIFLMIMMMLGISLVMMPAQTTGLNQLPRHLYPHGTAILNTLQQVAGAIGTALFISIMSSSTTEYLEKSSNPMLPEEGLQGMVVGLQDAFFVGAILATIALLIGLFIRKTKSSDEEEQGKWSEQLS